MQRLTPKERALEGYEAFVESLMKNSLWKNIIEPFEYYGIFLSH